MRKRIVTYEKQLYSNGGFTEIVLEFEKSNQRFVFSDLVGILYSSQEINKRNKKKSMIMKLTDPVESGK